VSDATIYRYEVPVDDRWHALELTGAVLHVGARRLDVVEFWALHTDSPPHRREYRVFGTGHPLDGGRHVGTVVHPSLVWHLFAREVGEQDEDGTR
jgi:hypothetical protein